MAKSPDLNSVEHTFELLNTKLNAETSTNKYQLKVDAVRAQQSILREEHRVSIKTNQCI